VPELPEVETVRRQIAPILAGACIQQASILDPRLVRPFAPELVAAEIEGERITMVDRRGKYLIVRFESGLALLVHLRMTGSFRVLAAGSAGGLADDDPHRRAVLRLDNGSDVAYRDVRRFGTWELFQPAELEAYLAARLGPEPLGAFSARALAKRLAARRTSLKAALLDQRTVAGLGNIYVDEALWHAQLHPLRPVGDLSADETERVHRAMRKVLRLGIKRQGASLRDYSTPRGEAGGMQHEFHAYGRDSDPCDRCGTPIAKMRVAGRGTWYCPCCQVDSTQP
jgi:formamidopyrimidine-DNA glycosylase